MKTPKGHAMNEDVMNKEDAQSVDVRKVERALTHLHVLVTSSHNAGWQANRDAWDVIRAALAHPRPTGDVQYALADVVRALRRFDECAEDGEDVNLGREWFDALTTIGLLKRVQRSPARWQMTDAGHSLLALPAPTGDAHE